MIMLVDGDVLCYNACKPRWQEKVKNNTNMIHLDEEGNQIPLVFTEEENKQYLKASWKCLKENLKGMKQELFADAFRIAVKGEGNFRDTVFPEYKANRKKAINPIFPFVEKLRKKLVADGHAVPSDGREADDLLRIWAEELRAENEEFIVCSVDKDLLCITGKHYRMHTKVIEEVSEEMALRVFYEQLLKGDPTDNIPGLPRVGDVTAKKLLKDFKTEEAFQEVVVSQYFQIYQEHWKEMLELNGHLLYLQKHFNDKFEVDSWPIVSFFNE